MSGSPIQEYEIDSAYDAQNPFGASSAYEDLSGSATPAGSAYAPFPDHSPSEKRERAATNPNPGPAYGREGSSGFSGTADGPAYGRAAASGSSALQVPISSASSPTELEAVRRELQLKQSELQRREEELERKYESYRKLKPDANWPPCYPVTYHSISGSIDPPNRGFVRRHYANLLLTLVALFSNWVTVLIQWWSKGDKGVSTDVRGGHALWATIYFFVGIFGAFALWYKPLYVAVRDRKSKKWILFFFWSMVHTAWSFVVAIGVPGMGVGGFVVMLDMFTIGATTAGFASLVTFILWFMCFVFSALLLKSSYAKYREMGGSVEKAKREVAAGAINDALIESMVPDGPSSSAF